MATIFHICILFHVHELNPVEKKESPHAFLMYAFYLAICKGTQSIKRTFIPTSLPLSQPTSHPPSLSQPTSPLPYVGVIDHYILPMVYIHL